MIAILKPFDQATQMLEGDKYPTLSLVNVVLNAIDTAILEMVGIHTERIARSLVRILAQQLQHRQNATASDLQTMAALLDPRTKPDATSPLWHRFPEFIGSDRTKLHSNESSSGVQVDVPAITTDLFYALTPKKSGQAPDLVTELNSVKQEGPVGVGQQVDGKWRNNDCMAWWRSNAHRFPRLVQVAQVD